MSTRRRIVRTSLYVLAVLAVGSILSACFLGASAIGPRNAFAETSQLKVGELGVGERTIAPLAHPVTTADKIPAEESASTTTVAALSTAATKRASTVAQYHKAKRKVRRPSVVTIGRGMLGRWQRALCSWYGPGFYGNTMAGGGRLRRNSMVVAHKRLPFGTKIMFSHKGRSVVAVVQDRGPYIHGRVFDLGPGTAKALKFSGVGVVKYRILSKGKGRRRG